MRFTFDSAFGLRKVYVSYGFRGIDSTARIAGAG